MSAPAPRLPRAASHSGAPDASPSASRADLARRIRDLGPWFHNLRLDGIETAPDHFLGDHPAGKWRGFAHVLPQDLAGRSVLDIGCNAGFFSIEMKRRGAGRGVGIDADPRYLRQAELATRHAGAEVELREMSVYDVGALGERFDLVLFLGVFYHLRHPLLALDLIHEHVADELLLFQSLQRGAEEGPAPVFDRPFEETAIFEDRAEPRLQFVERRFAGDPTNWFIPNGPAVDAMLRSAGFAPVARPEPEVRLCLRAGRGEAVEPPPRIAPPA